jgi:hypothetical protein
MIIHSSTLPLSELQLGRVDDLTLGLLPKELDQRQARSKWGM